jgi:hypothetical protein
MWLFRRWKRHICKQLLRAWQRGIGYVDDSLFWVVVVVPWNLIFTMNSLVQGGRYGWCDSDLSTWSSEDTSPVIDMRISCSESLLTEDCSTGGWQQSGDMQNYPPPPAKEIDNFCGSKLDADLGHIALWNGGG